MAVTFKPDGPGSEKTFVIGGQTSVDNSIDGVAGPFPSYAISKDPTRADNVPLNPTFTINFNGTALFDGEMLEAGARQAQAHLAIDEVLQLKGKTGVLEIAPYGGQAEIIQFVDARVTSVDLEDQDDESAGIQFQKYSLGFEAYRKKGITDSHKDDAENLNKLAGVISVEESWEISPLEEYNEFFTAAALPHEEALAATQPIKCWQISHTVSAQGVATGTTYTKAVAAGTTDPTDNRAAMGYQNAKAWVQSRLVNNPLDNDAIAKDLQGFNMELLVPNDADSTNPYKTYNHVKTYNQDTIGGSYSVTQTWTASRFSASHNIEYSFDRPEDAEYDTVTVQISVQGLDDVTPNHSLKNPAGTEVDSIATKQNKYQNALIAFPTIKASVHFGASTFYDVAGGAGTLKTEPVAASRTDNETIGTINYNATFNDKPQEDPDAKDESLTVTLNNTDHTIDTDRKVTKQGNQIVAIIPVLAKTDGPVIQDMNTTNVKTVSVSYSKTMTKEWRDANKPTENINTIPSSDAIVEKYKPFGGYRQNRVESWNPYNGQYNLDMDWVFSDNFTFGNNPVDPDDDDCPTGQVKNPTTGECEDDGCPPGQVKNPDTGECEDDDDNDPPETFKAVEGRILGASAEDHCEEGASVTVRNPHNMTITNGTVRKVLTTNGAQHCIMVTNGDARTTGEEGSMVMPRIYINCQDCQPDPRI